MRGIAIGLVVVVVVAFALVVGIAQLTDKGSPNRETDQSVNLVLNDMQKVQGKRIAIEGDVKTRLAPWAVLVGSSDATQVGLLVVSTKRLPEGIKQTTHIQAAGIAGPFSLGAFRRTHPSFSAQQLRESSLISLEGHPALVAARVVTQTPR